MTNGARTLVHFAVREIDRASVCDTSFRQPESDRAEFV